MRFGLLGCGSVARWIHLRALRGIPGATLVAAADPDRVARDRFARLTAATVLERPDDLLGRSDVDAVVICAPTHLHASLALSAAAAGKHFYLEKPIATTAEDARRIMAAATAAGVTAVIGFNRRHHPLFQQVNELLADGTIGQVHGVQTTFCERSPADDLPGWKRHRATGGGALLDLASHHIDQLRWMLATDVSVRAAAVWSEATEHDSARLELTSDNGVGAQGCFSFRAGPAEHLEFIGDRGTLRLDRHTAEVTLCTARTRGYGARRRWVRPTTGVLRWLAERVVRPSADPSYRLALGAFVDRIRGGPAAGATLEDGLRSLEVVLAAEAMAAIDAGAASCASS